MSRTKKVEQEIELKVVEKELEEKVLRVQDIKNLFFEDENGKSFQKYITEWDIVNWNFISGKYGPQIKLDLSRYKEETRTEPAHYVSRFEYLNINKVMKDNGLTSVTDLEDFLNKQTQYSIETYLDDDGEFHTLSKEFC